MKHWVLFSTIYILVYVLLALTFIPFDNFKTYGTFVFLTPIPTLPLVVIASYFSGKPPAPSKNKNFISLMVFHYLFTLALVFYALSSSLELQLTIKMFEKYTFRFLATVGWYLIGQVFIWRARNGDQSLNLQ